MTHPHHAVLNDKNPRMTRQRPLTWDQCNMAPDEELARAQREVLIPTIHEYAVTELLKQITPMLRNSSGQLCMYQPAEPRDPFKTSFNFEGDAACGELVDLNRYALLEGLPTYHACGYHAMFKPSIAEVLAQIPEGIRSQVSGFEVLFGDELTECVDYPGLYGHKTVTLLYRKVA